MQTAVCPDHARLRNLTLGNLDEQDSQDVVDHVRLCPDCQAVLAAIENDDPDSLVQLLKQPPDEAEFFSERECQWASVRALGAISGESSRETCDELPILPAEMGDYRLLEPIARGGMGVVYRAHHQRLSRDVAIKVISGRRLSDSRAAQRFEGEIRALGRLSHPNIVTALDAREVDGTPVLVMEFVDGLDLSQIVNRVGRLLPDDVASIGRSIAAALAYASVNGLIHRDIKPSNIMINMAGEVKLLDLGLARIRIEDRPTPEWTATGLVVGTPDYMSPEQINDSPEIDVRSDLYSLGCTLYRLLTGHAPYSGPSHASNFAKLAAHVAKTPIRFPQNMSWHTEPIAKLILRLVEKEPSQRPGTAAEVALEFEKLSSHADLKKLVAIARSTPPIQVDAPHSSSSIANKKPNRESSGSRFFPPWLGWSLAAGGLPLSFLLGVWLTVKRPNGESSKIEIPNGGQASVNGAGDVTVTLAQQQVGQAGPLHKQSQRPPFFDGSKLFVPMPPSQSATPANPLEDPFGYQSGLYPAPPQSVSPTPANPLENPFGDPTYDTPIASPADPFDYKGALQINSAKQGEMQNKDIDAYMKLRAKTNVPLYRGYSTDQWLDTLNRERSGDVQVIAGRALVALADSASEKEAAANVLLRKCRSLGTSTVGSDGTGAVEPLWMEMFITEFKKLLPDPGLKAIIQELDQGNAKSHIAIATLLSWWHSDVFLSPMRDQEQSEKFQKSPVAFQLKTIVTDLGKASEQAGERVLYGDVTQKSRMREIAFQWAISLKIPYDTLSPNLQEISKNAWEKLLEEKFTYRENVPNGMNPFPQQVLWLGYWKTLPAERREPVRVMQSLFANYLGTRFSSETDAIFADIKKLSDAERQEILKLLVERLAVCDFPDIPGDLLWESIFRWLSGCGVLTYEQFNQATAKVEQTMNEILADVKKGQSESETVKTLRERCREFNEILNGDPINPTVGIPSNLGKSIFGGRGMGGMGGGGMF